MKRTVLLRALALAIVAISLTSSIVTISFAKQPKYEISGKWQGKFPREQVNSASDSDNPVAVEIEIKEKDGKLSGTSTFYVIVNQNDHPQVKGSVESALIDPRFDGTSLKFSIKAKGQQPDPEARIEMQMKLTSPTEADLENLEDSQSPLIKMKKVH
jgi:hypothetical protein